MGQSCTREQHNAFFTWSEQKLAFFNAKDEQTHAVAKATPAAPLLADGKHRVGARDRSRTRSCSRGSSALSCADVSLRMASDTEILQELQLRWRRNRSAFTAAAPELGLGGLVLELRTRARKDRDIS